MKNVANASLLKFAQKKKFCWEGGAQSEHYLNDPSVSNVRRELEEEVEFDLEIWVVENQVE